MNFRTSLRSLQVNVLRFRGYQSAPRRQLIRKVVTPRGAAFLGIAAFAAMTPTLVYLDTRLNINDDDSDVQSGGLRKGRRSMTSLIKSYFVFAVCSIPPLVDHAPFIMATLMAVPGLKTIVESIIKHTFFDQVRLLSKSRPRI